MKKNISKQVEDIKAGRISGATFGGHGEPISWAHGYLVSVLTVDLPKRRITPEMIVAVTGGLCHRADVEKKNINCFGLYDYGNGFVSVDANIHTLDLQRALDTARESKQVAIWDCAKSEAITVPAA